MYVWAHVCMSVYVGTCMYVCIGVCECMFGHMYVCMYMWGTCMYVCNINILYQNNNLTLSYRVHYQTRSVTL